VALVALVGFAINIVLAMLIAGSVAGGLGGLMASSAATDMSLSAVLGGAGLATMGVGMLIAALVAPWVTGATAHAGKLAL